MRWILFIVIYLLFNFYAFQSVKTLTGKKWVYVMFFALTLIVLANFIYQFITPTEGRVLTPAKSYALGFLLTIIALKVVLISFLFIEDVLRVFYGIYGKLFGEKPSFYLPSRRKFISQIALGIAAIPFASMLYGIYKGRYNFKVLTYELEYPDLPEAFDGYQITQLSDIHSGSFDNKEKIEYAVNLVNQQQSDAILFTGDMVNNKADEMEQWKSTFAKLTAKDGVFSVLGNHDYGDYVNWPSEEAKVKNLEKLFKIQEDMGFKLLKNETHFITKNDQRIALVGVENWGAGRFKKAGDIDKATVNVNKEDFKILMSHDPTHWEQIAVTHPLHYHLTLSGHTHGMQFGIEIPGWIKWSPAKWRYKYWAGLYEQDKQIINVNRGFGYLAFPGRVGIWPEITVIKLKKSSQLA
ncbi:metallophosphoesterase [Mesoflavibacter profundi]|uniref:metallophosphoesterase n=1 Tax=Mesoflavibacter profundi TaxID=2708110 RepID=UPI00168AD6F9|nr:metallophosphoesterase [Mesoflavibacter profundi]